MKIEHSNGKLVLQRKHKWSPLGGILFGAIAAAVIGVASEEVAAAITVFVIVSVAGIGLTLQERLSRYRTVVIDFEGRTIAAHNNFFGKRVKSLDLAPFNAAGWTIANHRSDKKLL